MNTTSNPETSVQNTSTHSTGAVGPVHVWLVDDHANLRSLIAQSLELAGGIVCTRQFGSPNELLSALASRIGPDVILLDVQMGEFNGIDAIPAIKSLSRSTRVLMFTTCYNEQWHNRALASGASGFLLKSDPLERITGSICVVGESARTLMRAEPVKINFRKPANAGKATVPVPLPAKPKADGAFSWFKLFGRN